MGKISILLPVHPENIILSGFRNDTLRYLTGKTLGEVAKMRGTIPRKLRPWTWWFKTVAELETVYFLMSEDIVKQQITLPYMSFGYGCRFNGPRRTIYQFKPTSERPMEILQGYLGNMFGKSRSIPLEEAIYKLTGLSAFETENQKKRECSRSVIMQMWSSSIQNKIIDKATFAEPHQFAEGNDPCICQRSAGF